MSFINVTFGYNQSKLFNINCEIAPLIDSINIEAYKAMKNKLQQREDFFNKEINAFKKEQGQLEKKLEKLEQPEEAEKPKPIVVVKQRGGKKKTKKELEAEEAERKRIEEEAERLRKQQEEELKRKQEEEERKKKEEEEAAKKNKKGADKKKAKDEPVEEIPVIETEEQKKEKEKQALRTQIDAFKTKIAAYEAKRDLCIQERNRQDTEESRKKVLDLMDKNAHERKFLKDGSREGAGTVLAERRCYVFVEIKPPAEDGGEEEIKPITINGAAIRTPDEDIIWEQEQKDLEAAAPKGGKAAPKGKKK